MLEWLSQLPPYKKLLHTYGEFLMRLIPQEAIDLMSALEELLPEYGDSNYKVEYSEYKDKVSAEVYSYKININSKVLYNNSTDDIVSLVVKKFNDYTKGYI